MDIQTSLNKLFSLHTFGIKLGLDNVKNFLSHIGNPQNDLQTFHVAGSNGKGSVAAFISSILQEFDYSTGLYTSPHFIRFNERIKINGNEIEDSYIANFTSKHWDYIENNKLTFFEVTTAMAFQYFSDNKVEYAVIETGLGGRLDATNVLKKPLAIVITSISLEHTNILGNSIEQIAFEKSEIIKDNSKVFTGKLPDEALEVIQKKCINTGSELFLLEDYINEKENSLELYTEELELDDWTMPLRGNYQKYNAALAGLTISKTLLLNNLDEISRGITSVISNTGLQGRYEFYNNKPDIIFDSAHNSDGIKNFLNEFHKDSKNYSRKTVIFGAMKDKLLNEMFKLLNNSFDEIQITTIDYERAASIDVLKQTAENLDIKVIIQNKPIDFIKDFKRRNKSECLVVLGSIYLLGEIKSSLALKEIA